MTSKPLLAAALAVVLSLAQPAAANFKAGVAAYESGDFAKALAEWKPLADGGDPAAQYAIGLLHQYGQGVPPNPVEAVAWFAKAAEKGDANARFAIGLAHESGQGAAKDYQAAMQWYLRATETGHHAEAEYSLGRLYLRGRGVPRDAGKALEWFRKAARHDHAAAQYLLAAAYESGAGVEPDRVEAYVWYGLAARADPLLLAQYEPTFNAKLAMKTLKDRMASWEIQNAQAKLAHAVKTHLTPEPAAKAK